MEHSALDRGMFWAGALIALVPVLIGLGVAALLAGRARAARRRADGRRA